MAVDATILTLPPMVPPDVVSTTQANSGSSINDASDVPNAIVAAATGLRYYGFTCMEDANQPASFVIKHSATASGGTALEYVTLNAGQSTSDWYGPDGQDAQNGLSVQWISGSFKVALRHKTVT